VKNASQRFWVLFTGAQKTANLACLLCTIGGEKDPMPFTKVVEQCKIYNFGIETLDHFCWKKLRKTRSVEGGLNCFCLDAQSAPSHRRRAHSRKGPYGTTRRGRPVSGGPCTVLPFSLCVTWARSLVGDMRSPPTCPFLHRLTPLVYRVPACRRRPHCPCHDLATIG
jgi:hypothetical protein